LESERQEIGLGLCEKLTAMRLGNLVA